MIYIEIIHKYWSPGEKLGISKSERARFESYMAQRYIKQVKDYVDHQVYLHKWAPLSRRYLAFKKAKGYSLKTWEATRKMSQGLKYFKRNRKVTFDRRYKYSNGAQLLQVARSNEYGTRTVPPRPLFRPVLWLMSKNIRRYYKEFKATGGKIP